MNVWYQKGFRKKIVEKIKCLERGGGEDLGSTAVEKAGTNADVCCLRHRWLLPAVVARIRYGAIGGRSTRGFIIDVMRGAVWQHQMSNSSPSSVISPCHSVLFPSQITEQTILTKAHKRYNAGQSEVCTTRKASLTAAATGARWPPRCACGATPLLGRHGSAP